MEFIFLMLLFLIFIAYQIMVIVQRAVCGWYVSPKKAMRYLNMKPNEYCRNMIDGSMLHLNGCTNFITPTLLPAFTYKYYINDVGVVWRFGKLHRQIKEYYNATRI